MCGICGVIYKNQDKYVDVPWLSRMNDTMFHRGPDDAGIYVSKNIGLGHRRLSIIDLSGGHQPIFNEDKSIAIVFNGEIYNHEEVRKILEEKGHKYYTKSDTETIIHAYEEFGVSCVDHLRGMFAFAIYDKRKERLMIARDRVGKKPVYFYKNNEVFIFASEIKAIFKSGLLKKEVNKEVLDFYLSIGYVPGDKTLFKNIYKLEPGCFLTLENNNIKIKQYWDIRDIKTQDIGYNVACKKVRDKLKESVRIRLMSEVPLGVFLSGGLDSSVIVALMSEVVNDSIKTFSVGYKDAPLTSELKYARIVADKFKTEHHELYLTADDLFASIDSFLDFSEEPIVESAGIALYQLAKLAKTKSTVLLSGEGADEALAGYQIYPKMKKMQILHYLSLILPRKFIGRKLSASKLPEKTLKYLDWIMAPFGQRYRSLSFDLSLSIKERMYTDSMKQEFAGVFDKYFLGLHEKAKMPSMLRKMLYIDTKSWLAEDILLKADRMTMAASVELRAPFLDQEFIELSSSLPDNYRLNGDSGKYILKDIVTDILPKEIIYRKKRGFPVPLTQWFKGPLQARARSLLLEKKSIERGYFKPGYVKGLFDAINKGDDVGKRIFSLITLEVWHRKFID